MFPQEFSPNHMWNNCTNGEEPNWGDFKGIEIAACQEMMRNTAESYWEVVTADTYEAHKPVIFTLYGITPDGCAEAWHDMKTAAQVLRLAQNVKFLNPHYIVCSKLFKMEK